MRAPATQSIVIITRSEETIEILHGLDPAEAVRDAQILADYAHYPQLNSPAFSAIDFGGRHAELGGSPDAVTRFEQVDPRDIMQVDVVAGENGQATGVIHPSWTWVRPADQD